MSDKTLDDYFADWEIDAFGYGYGTGELYILPALRSFLLMCHDEIGRYDHRELEESLGSLPAWLLINTLCGVDIIEYGTSPRFAWLTQRGLRLREYVRTRSEDDLYKNVCGRTEDYVYCYPHACNCGEGGYEKGRVCQNPFWLKASLSQR